MNEEKPTVFVIDDDPSARRGLTRLIRAAGMSVEAFDSAREFLRRSPAEDGYGCIVLDVKMPGLSGLDLQSELMKSDGALPIIFVSGHSEIPEAAQALKQGAMDFLTKPVDMDHLLTAIAEALEQDHENRKTLNQQTIIRKRLITLSPREHTILEYVISGMLNKQIAYALGITEDTVKVHRRRVMKKMQAGSLAELVRMAEFVGVKPAEVRD